MYASSSSIVEKPLGIVRLPKISQIFTTYTTKNRKRKQKTLLLTDLSVSWDFITFHKTRGGGYRFSDVKSYEPSYQNVVSLDISMQYTLAYWGSEDGGMWPHKSEGFMWGSCEGGNEGTLQTQQATQIWVQNLQAVLECIMNLHDVHSEEGVFQCLQSSKLLY